MLLPLSQGGLTMYAAFIGWAIHARFPEFKPSAKVLAALPKAAEIFRRQIAKGIEGDEREVLRARVLLKEWVHRENTAFPAARWRPRRTLG